LRAALVALLLLVLNTAATAGTISRQLAVVLDRAHPEERIGVIVRFRGDAPVDGTELLRDMRRADAVREVRRRAENVRTRLPTGGVQPLGLVNGAALAATPTEAAHLAARADVERLMLDTPLEIIPDATLGAADPSTLGETATSYPWNLADPRISALNMLGVTGQGVVVANVDTGVDATHPALAANFRAGGWLDLVAGQPSPYDDYPASDAPWCSPNCGLVNAHGTGVMGLMAGSPRSTGQAVGVAPGAQWIAVKAFDAYGVSTASLVIQALEWLLDPDGAPETDDAPDIVNLSFRNPDALPGELDPTMQEAIDALVAQGIAVVCAAGNSGPASETSVSPANYPSTISVGSVSEGYLLLDVSSRGPAPDGSLFPDLSAPGGGVSAPDASGAGIELYGSMSGTSSAAPHVAGLLALLREAFPDRSWTELVQTLKDTATDIEAVGPDNDSGYGVIEARDAYDALAPTPPAVFLPGPNAVLLLN
jgi:bacillopeptidase F